ncbi:hypothetical protein [Paulownia witches'-broom phytoplasma]|nr:hypothetical protein [Paulownia witches'-broom phytoplasma]
MLSQFKLKYSIKHNYDKSQKDYQNQTITDLQKLYDITSAEK